MEINTALNESHLIGTTENEVFTSSHIQNSYQLTKLFFSILNANFIEYTFKDVGFLLTKHREIFSMSACTKWMRKEITVMKAAFSDTHAVVSFMLLKVCVPLPLLKT